MFDCEIMVVVLVVLMVGWAKKVVGRRFLKDTSEEKGEKEKAPLGLYYLPQV